MKQRAILIFLSIVTLVGFYFLNVYTNIAIDDFVYKHIVTNVANDEGIRVKTVYDIIQSQYNHYFITNGRLLVNGLAQLFLMSDNKLYFNFFNTLVFGVFLFLLLKQFYVTTNKIRLHHYLILIISVWFLVPGANHTLLWLTGSINYLWATVLVLFFLDLYKKIHAEKRFHKKVYLPFIFVFAFLSGFTHEVLSLGISAALFFNFIKNYKHYSIYSIVLLAGFFIGTFLLIIAPGNMIRLEGNVENVSVLAMIVKKIGRLVISLPNLLAFVLMMFVLIWIKIKDKIGFQLIYEKNALLLHSVFISILFIVLSGAIDPRVFFGIAVFSLMVLFSITGYYSEIFSSVKMKVAYGVLIAAMLFEYSHVVQDVRYNKMIFDADEITWRSNKDNVFPLHEKKLNRFVCTGLGGSDRYFWSNKVMSWYYHKDYMIFIPTSLYENAYQTNSFISQSTLSKNDSLAHAKDSLKIYYTNKTPYLIHKTTQKNTSSITSGSHVLYEFKNKIENASSTGLIAKIKNKIIPNKENATQSEVKPCFVLPTKFGTYLVSEFSTNLPINQLNKATFFADGTNTNQLFSYNLNEF